MNLRLMITSIVLLAGLATTSPSQAQQRQRPNISSGLGYRIIFSDRGTLLRGVSLAWDGGDPYGSLPKNIPTSKQLERLSREFGLNSLHLYLEGNSSENPNPPGINAADADALVQATADAGLYLIITIGCNGENGTIHDLQFAKDFWTFYAPRYKDESHVIYEVHNEPASSTPNQWSMQDWNNQVELYETVRPLAPDTLILLCSFMGFAGDPTFGAEYLAAQGVDWTNAGFAHHGYESKEGIENAIGIMQSSENFPALLCTEFWPGDTEGQGYNSMYESRLNGWMQFQWLGADDEDLNLFRSKITAAGTIWTPDDEDARWPATGSPDHPANGSIVGLYQRSAERFVRVLSTGGNQLRADATTYTGGADDAFIIESILPRLFRLRIPSGLYVSTIGEADPLNADTSNLQDATIFEWIELPNGDRGIRAWNSGCHLLRWNPSNNRIFPDGDNGRAPECRFALVTKPGTFPAPLVGDPFNGTPQLIPGRIEAEDFDLGGEGVSYVDSDATNNGNRYRVLEGVDIETTTDAGGGHNIGWISTEEWIDYTIEVTGNQPTQFNLEIRAASPSSSAKLGIIFDGIDPFGTINVPATGGFQQWTTITRTVTLNPGVQIMRFENRANPTFNVNWFELSRLPCDADFNGDDRVDGADLATLLISWGSCSNDCPADFNGDGIVNGADLSRVLTSWGLCP